jgi:hypothetical protein
MVAQHCAYVSTWGEDCERVHHLFDDAYLDVPSLISRGSTRPLLDPEPLSREGESGE